MRDGDRDMIGQPISSYQPAGAPGIRLVKDEDRMKAPHTGTYVINGHRFRMFEGDVIPDGAVVNGEPPEPTPQPKKAGKKSAPETPEGAGPVIETPEGSDEAETPENDEVKA